jgi:hypothetical protein
MMMKLSIDDERLVFEVWLKSHYGYSKKAFQDCISRCRRIEKKITPCLADMVSNEAGFSNLMSDIQKYSVKVSSNTPSAYALTGTLRAAAKRYALFKFPKLAKNYPSSYERTHYN